ncbi:MULTISPECIES: alpha/beta hydrolase [unclassified Marinimicrobium]|jgi:pectinesterase|uniref:alpha/beta hydrolase n=1 Tax=unclassified Marinimicrobium TaxID=2632100 RepID=UPI00257A4719|nr:MULTISPECIES: alpha/beta hydrolase [unclassified Marinimicrobium]
MKQFAWLFALLFLFGCARSVITEPPVPFENTYTAENTYHKEVKQFPHIEIASLDTPEGVRVERDLTYVQYGRRALQLDLHRPEAGSFRPAVVLVHGGGWRSGYRENLTPLANALAERGFVVANISYRLAPEARFPAAIHDVKAAIRWLREHAEAYGVNPDQIAVGGTSAGGQIASLTGITAGDPYFDPQRAHSPASSDVQAILNIDGLSDFTSEEARHYEDDPSKNPSSAGSWFGGRYAEQTELWHKGSPTYYVHADMPPILFLNSARERFGVGRDEMIAKMEPLGVRYHVQRFDNTPHTFWLFDPWLQPTADEVSAFLRGIWGGTGTSPE